MIERMRQLLRWVVEPDDEPPPEQRVGPGMDSLRLTLRTAFLLAAFLVLNKFFLKVFRLPEEAYAGESILWECLRVRGVILGPALAVGGFLFFFFPRLRRGWDQFEGGPSLRWFVGALSVILAWAGAAYAHNPWFDQPHLADRAALAVLAALVLWRPVFALPFAAFFWAMIWQQNYPPLGFQIQEAEFKPLVKILTLFSAAFLIHAVLGGRKMTGFLFLTLCLVAANFWEPGLGKLRIGWITHGHLYCILPAAYTHGWLAFLEPDTVASITRVLAALDWPMRIGTLFVECGALLFFLHARVAKWYLILFTILLGAFFLLLGFFFWKWMLLQGALLVLLFRGSHPASVGWRRDLFTRGHFALSIVIIGAGSIWFAPARLAWLDTPLANTFRYEAVGSSGAVYELPLRFFGPYESHFAMASFVRTLSSSPIALTSTYGVTGDRSLADALLAARSLEDVIALEEAQEGTTHEETEEYAAIFDEFLRRSAEVSNRHVSGADGSRSRALSLFRPPPFLWTFPSGSPYKGEELIDTIRVYRVSSFFDGEKYTLFRRDLLRTIDVRS